MEEPSSHRHSKSLSSGPLAGHSTIFTLKLKIICENPCSVFLYWAAISTAFFSLTPRSHLIYQDLLSESTLQVGHLAVSTRGYQMIKTTVSGNSKIRCLVLAEKDYM